MISAAAGWLGPACSLASEALAQNAQNYKRVVKPVQHATLRALSGRPAKNWSRSSGPRRQGDGLKFGDADRPGATTDCPKAVLKGLNVTAVQPSGLEGGQRFRQRVHRQLSLIHI